MKLQMKALGGIKLVLKLKWCLRSRLWENSESQILRLISKLEIVFDAKTGFTV